MFTPEMISLAIALITLAKPVVKVFCYWLELELKKRYDVN